MAWLLGELGRNKGTTGEEDNSPLGWWGVAAGRAGGFASVWCVCEQPSTSPGLLQVHICPAVLGSYGSSPLGLGPEMGLRPIHRLVRRGKHILQ